MKLILIGVMLLSAACSKAADPKELVVALPVVQASAAPIASASPVPSASPKAKAAEKKSSPSPKK